MSVLGSECLPRIVYHVWRHHDGLVQVEQLPTDLLKRVPQLLNCIHQRQNIRLHKNKHLHNGSAESIIAVPLKVMSGVPCN